MMVRSPALPSFFRQLNGKRHLTLRTISPSKTQIHEKNSGIKYPTFFARGTVERSTSEFLSRDCARVVIGLDLNV
jgi:hypothetical protein